MDNIISPEEFHATERLDLKSYFTEYSECVRSISSVSRDKKGKASNISYIRKLLTNMGVEATHDYVCTMASICNPDNLTCEKENPGLPAPIPDTPLHPKTKLAHVHPLLPEAETLEVVKVNLALELEAEKMNPYLSFKRGFKQIDPDNKHLPDMTPAEDYKLLIMFYRPKKLQRRCQGLYTVFSHAIEVLGRQTLTQLRDKIVCTADMGMCREVENTKEQITEDVKDVYPSGFFFIDNVFYNDMRHPLAVDQSEPIRLWAKDKNIADFEVASMEETHIRDLKPRIGYPYLYMHQGDCEHVFVISDASLLQKDDDLCEDHYPRITYNVKSNSVRCFTCTVKKADWLVVGSCRTPQEKIFQCTECCDRYNYIDGQKVGDFKLYPHYGDIV